jgi:hypothetical protein
MRHSVWRRGRGRSPRRDRLRRAGRRARRRGRSAQPAHELLGGCTGRRGQRGPGVAQHRPNGGNPIASSEAEGLVPVAAGDIAAGTGAEQESLWRMADVILQASSWADAVPSACLSATIGGRRSGPWLLPGSCQSRPRFRAPNDGRSRAGPNGTADTQRLPLSYLRARSIGSPRAGLGGRVVRGPGAIAATSTPADPVRIRRRRALGRGWRSPS